GGGPRLGVVERRILEHEAAYELRSVARRDERGQRAQRMSDEHGGLFRDLAKDSQCVVGERAQRIVRSASTLAVTARVVRDRAVAGRKARVDVLLVLGSCDAVLPELERRRDGDAPAGV